MYPSLLGQVSGGTAPPLSEHQILVLLVQLVALIGIARALGGLMKRAGQPAVVGELVAGVILGPSILGRAAPDLYDWIFGDEVVTSIVFALAWIGVILLLVVIGYETDLAIIARFRRATAWVSAGGFLVPLAAMGAVAFLVPDSFVGELGDRPTFVGFFALALSVSALPVVAKILQDMGLLRRNFGQITLAAGMAMDAVGWLVLAGLTGVALDGFRPDLLARSFGGLVLLLVLAATAGRWILDRVMRVILDRGSGLNAALTVSVVAALIGAGITQVLQLEAILGAFVVGILLASTRHQLPEVRRTLETVTAAIFAPIFFAFSGLQVDVGLLASPTPALLAVGLIFLAVAAKLAGTIVGGRFGGVRGREALALGSGLSALGAMGIVVALVALNLSVISQTGYTVLVVAAIATSLLAPQLLRAVVSGWEIPVEEAGRLEREAMQEASEILGSRRILLPTRGGANSRYAARIISSVFEDPDVTVLAVDVPAGRSMWGRRRKASSSDPTQVDLDLGSIRHRVLRVVSTDPAAAIARESRLGYDLLVVGASADERRSAGVFSNVVDRILSLVDLPTLVVRLPERASVAEGLPNRVLVPVVASRTSRAAAELGFSIAAGSSGSAAAVHFVNRPTGSGAMFDTLTSNDALLTGQELVAESAALGSRLGATVEGIVKIAANPEAEIVALANQGGFDLLAIGASSRAVTGRPFFGHRVNYILERTQIPVAVVTLPSQSRY
ncbi:MAG: cation:proton antiporter [Acidimicrobiia bacterium]